VAPPHPHLGDRDFLAEACEATAELGVACVAYVNSLFGGPDAWREHPGWAQRRPDGTFTEMGDARAMCPLSPYGDRIVAAVGEIAERYSVQGMYFDEPSFQSWCSCENCEAAFKHATGNPLPHEARSDDPAWFQFVDWRYDQIAAFIARARAAFKQHRPQSAFWCQHAFPMTSTVLPQMRKLFEGMLPQRVPASAEGWSRTLFYGQRVERQVQSLDVLSAELWRRFGDRPVTWPGTATSYLRSLAAGRPVVAFLEYPDFPWSLRAVPDDELAYVVADVRARGGHPWFPLYAPGESDERGWDAAGGVHRAIADFVPADAAPIAEVAVGYSPSTADLRSLDDVERDYLEGVMGTVQLLLESHVPFRMVSLDTLDAGLLDDVEVLVVPSAAVVPDETLAALSRFVEGGGSAILLGDLATHRADGTLRGGSEVEELTGARTSAERVPLGIAYLAWGESESLDGKDEADALFAVRGAVPALEILDADVLGSVRLGYQLFEAPPEDAKAIPVVTRARRGEGVVVATGLDVGGLAQRFRAPGIAGLLRTLLRAAGHESAFDVDAPATVSFVPWRTASGWVVFLLNRTGLEDHGTAVPVGPVTVRVPRGADAVRASVRAIGVDDAVVADASAGDGTWTVTVPAVGVWAVLEIGEENR
jgi:hypothetical protein